MREFIRFILNKEPIKMAIAINSLNLDHGKDNILKIID